VHTKLDLAFSVGYVSRYMEEPHEEHLAAVKHNLWFIAGTSELVIFYPRRKGEAAELTGYSYSDLAGDLDYRKSTSEIIFF
jgi:hypothetical protein